MQHQVRSIINRLYNHFYFFHYRSKSPSEVFSDIYTKRIWRSESTSGPGSKLDQTIYVREAVRQVIAKNNIKSLLDIPCGDWFWMRYMDLSGVHYTGADIVKKIIDQNQSFASDKVTFLNMNLLEDALPAHDLILCRDCLVHFSYQDIDKALQNILKSDCKFLLTTTFPDKKNYNIVTGNWRPINLEAAPFRLPKPLITFNEKCTEGDGRNKDKSLALWELDQLRNAY